MAGRKPVAPQAAPAATPPPAETASAAPKVPADVTQRFIPPRAGPPGATLVYQPRLLGSASVRFADGKNGIDTTNELLYLAPLDAAPAIDWDKAATAAFPAADLDTAPQSGATFEPAPAAATNAKSYAAWKAEFASWLFRNATLDLRQAGREQRDALVEKMRADYAPKVHRLEEKIRNAEQAVTREQGQAHAAELQTAVSVGATVLGAILGRKATSATLGRATTAARGVGRSVEQQQDVGRAKADVAAAQQELDALNAEIERRAGGLDAAPLRPTKSNIDVRLVALAWAPYWRDAQGTLTPAWA
jgi:hypothetical protein